MKVAEGIAVRDFSVVEVNDALWTHDKDLNVLGLNELSRGSRRLLWPCRTSLADRKKFGISMHDRGLTWWEWREVYARKIRPESASKR